MSRRGKGYGSEDHLRKQLVAQDRRLEKTILEKLRRSGGIHGESIRWHSNYLADDKPELRGMDFLPEPDRDLWKLYWPDPQAGRNPLRRGIHNWDAVGTIATRPGAYDWVLVEAKAHLHELSTNPGCLAGLESRSTITRAFQKTRFNMGITAKVKSLVPDAWFEKGYYQVANRLAALNFLLQEREPPISAQLVFIYFIGDRFTDRMCPQVPAHWENVLNRTYAKLELPHQHAYSTRVHRVFFDVSPVALEA